MFCPIDSKRLQYYNLITATDCSDNIGKKNMNRIYTIKDIATRVGVSPSTISRVLSNSPAANVVSEKTRKHIHAVVEELGYVPNVNASRLVKNKTNLIGVVIPGMEGTNVHSSVLVDRVFNVTLGGIESVLKNNNYRILLIFKNDKFVENKEYLRLFRENSVDGLLVWGARFNDNYWEEASGYNLLMLNSHCEHYDKLNYIGHDNVAAARAITRNLLRQGHRKIVYIGSSEDISIIRERFEGYKLALAEAGVPFRPELCFSGDIGQKAVNRIAEDIVAGKIDADAVQCVSDGIALHCGYNLMNHGYRIPEDIILTGGDRIEDEYAAMTAWKFPLPTFRLNSFRMGELAAQKLLHKINGDAMPPIRELLPVELVDPQTINDKIEHKALNKEKRSCPSRELIPI